MKNELEKKYGLPTAIGMVVGIVIGSGVFFKAEAVLKKTGGNVPLGILAWLIVGIIMIVCSYVFATMASQYEKVNGLVDYAESTCGERYAYNIAWFMATIYTPGLVSVLAWVSARYFCVIFGWDITGGICMTVACLFLCLDFVLNMLSPRVAGHFQVSTTVIKMIPLALMAVLGIIMGIANGTLAENFTSMGSAAASGTSAGAGLMGSVVAVAFAYEGWILATSINAELKDAKKNLPRALVIGSLIVVATYIFYYIGLNGTVTSAELMANGQAGAKLAFQHLFGSTLGGGIFVLVVISCLGTLNGLTLSNCRAFYAMAARGRGIKPKMFSQIDSVTNMPTNSSALSLAFSAVWMLYFYGANLTDPVWFGNFSFDSSELPIITLYGMYIPIFLQFMRKSKDLNAFKRIVMPALALAGCIFMVYAAFAGHGVSKVLHYLIIFAIVMIVGNFFYNKKE